MICRRPVRLVRVVAAAAVVCAATLDASAARLPDWAEPVVEAAPEVEATGRSETWRVLFREKVFEVSAHGEVVIQRRVALQALSSLAEATTEGILIEDGREISRARAWHLEPGERRASRSGRREIIDLSLGDAFVSDAKVRVVSIDDVVCGSLVFYEFESEETPKTLSFVEVIPQVFETVVAQVRFRLPEGWSLRGRWLGIAGAEPYRDGRDWIWQVRDLPALDELEYAEPVRGRSPRLVVSVHVPDGVQVPGASLDDWDAFASWFMELAGHQFEVTEDVSRTAAEIVPPDAPVAERIEATAVWVRDSVRYIAEALGIGALRPRPAAETLETRWGDCKDKTTLLSALLASQGIESHPVLVHATLSGTVDEQLPAIRAFNHAILGIPLEGAGALPPRLSSAVGEVEGIGPMLFVDATDEYTSIGWLPAGVAGKTAVVVTRGGGHLTVLPGSRPGDHTLDLGLDATMDAAGRLDGRLEARFRGELAAGARASHRDSEDGRIEYWKEIVADHWPGSEFVGYERVAGDEQGAFVERIRFSLAGARGGFVQLVLEPSRWLGKASVRRRDVPVTYRHPRELRFRARVGGLRGAVALPNPISRNVDGLAIEASFQQDGAAVSAEGRVTLSKTRFSPDEFRSLRRGYAAMRSLASMGFRAP